MKKFAFLLSLIAFFGFATLTSCNTQPAEDEGSAEEAVEESMEEAVEEGMEEAVVISREKKLGRPRKFETPEIMEAAIVHVTEHGTPEGDYPTYPTSDYGA